MRWLGALALAVVATVVHAQGYVPPLAFDASDSFFLPEESHTVTEVTETERTGWLEHVDSVRFGAYGITVTQRLNPETGMPEAGKRRWGDSFVGVIGKKPAAYMASNWSPWSFLDAEVTLDAGEAVPSPTMVGLLVYAGLRELTDGRITADLIWRDVAGGHVRARCVGWRGLDGFGLQLRYWPPPGRTVEKLTWVLTAHPYDYSDRGYWQRRRWLSTPDGDGPLGDEPTDLGSEWLAVLHNRFAHTESGVTLALDRETIAGASVQTEGNRVPLRLAPVSADAPVTLVLGDWVDDVYDRARDRWFGQSETLGERLAETRTLQSEDTPAAVEAFLRAEAQSREAEAAAREQAAAWVTERQWRQ